MEHSDDIQWGAELLIRVAITLLIQDSVTALRSALKLCESGLFTYPQSMSRRVMVG